MAPERISSRYFFVFFLSKSIKLDVGTLEKSAREANISTISIVKAPGNFCGGKSGGQSDFSTSVPVYMHSQIWGFCGDKSGGYLLFISQLTEKNLASLGEYYFSTKKLINYISLKITSG